MKMWLYWVLMAAVVAPAAAQVYKVVDSQGRVTYTDSPPKDGRQYEQVELKSLNRQQAIEPVPSLAPQQPVANGEEQTDEAIAYRVQVTAPTDGTQVPPGQRDLPVAAQLEPPLADNHGLQFLLNGEALAAPGRNTSLVIEEIYRGAHRLTAQVVNGDGEVMAQSDPVEVFVHRPTVNSPAR